MPGHASSTPEWGQKVKTGFFLLKIKIKENDRYQPQGGGGGGGTQTFLYIHRLILGNPGVTHSVPTECSGYGMGHTWVTEDDIGSKHFFFFFGGGGGVKILNFNIFRGFQKN